MSKTMKRKSRNSAIELLRILSMFMIIAQYFVVYGVYEWHNNTIIWYNFLIMWGKISVDLFVLISGYYLIERKNSFSLNRLYKFWNPILFYSILCFMFCF